ncbi:transposase [Candidatus Enterovibrio escicola]|uniref:transposase n=1 Tax=Candidatus Enterovibrio escicola TaxID=1927127 RepID=UPI001CC3222F
MDENILLKDVEEFFDDYQWERANTFNVTQSAIHYALKCFSITFKRFGFTLKLVKKNAKTSAKK